MHNDWVLTLYDYTYTNEKIETPAGSVERGVVGSKMEYRTQRRATSKAKDRLSEYVVTD